MTHLPFGNLRNRLWGLAAPVSMCLVLPFVPAAAQTAEENGKSSCQIAQADSPDHGDGGGEAIATGTDANLRITIPVMIDGRGPHRFLVDTGSERTVISASLARRLGLVSSESQTLVSIVDRQQVAMVDLPPLQLGLNSSINLNTPVLQTHNIGADGILGLDSLSDKRVEIQDFGRCMKVFDTKRASDAKDEGPKFRMHARESKGQLILSSADATGFPIKTVIDTGAEINIGNHRLLRLLQKRGGLHIFARREITGVTGGSREVQIGYISHLKIGDAVMRNLAVAFVDSPALDRLGLADTPTLIIGMNTLSSFERIMIDFPEREITFVTPSARVSPRTLRVVRPYGS
ncbi:MAG: hypothetical protein GW859_08415 [Sphingomonadales bacterium]|nr:hypothetical protein [Sphingomonadales bacterium]